MSKSGGQAPPFSFPYFYNFPPYFTLQPVQATRDKQIQLWKDLILNYCKHYRIYAINLEEDFPLFVNKSIERKLNFEASQTLCSALVAEGRADWLDKGRTKVLVLWRKADDWANVILDFVRTNALEDSVMTLPELQCGEDSQGTELEGLDLRILQRAIKVLESRGKATLFKGASGDDDGVKFFS